MEQLLHYAWKHRMLPPGTLHADTGETLDIIDPGLHNPNAGPDFLNAKVRVDGQLWTGNVELHERASDWMRHNHHTDAAYDNVVLHVCARIDAAPQTRSGRRLTQLQMEVPEEVRQGYRELLEEETYPPCHRTVARLDSLTVRSWLSALTAERLEEKTTRIGHWLERTGGDWERTAFITLARGFGFGVNAEAFEQWAAALPLTAVARHRDNLFQLEAFFMGQAGLLADEAVAPERRDDYFARLQGEYAFLRHKFGLQPLEATRWRFLRMRPQNFPHVRLSQLAALHHASRIGLSRLLEAPDAAAMRRLMQTGVTPYWETHYGFGRESAARSKVLQGASLDALVVNVAAPLLFAYGRSHMDEALCERAFSLLEQTRAERNYITRSWERAGIKATSAADSQALIRLKLTYCDRHDCLRCRFGAAHLGGRRTPPAR